MVIADMVRGYEGNGKWKVEGRRKKEEGRRKGGRWKVDAGECCAEAPRTTPVHCEKMDA
jgi:hypothetical protein